MNEAIKYFCLVTFIIIMVIVPNSWCIPIDLVGEDGIITQEDILKFIESWHSTPDDPNWNPLADVNDDGIIDAEDFNSLSEVFQDQVPIYTPTEGPTPTNTPIQTPQAISTIAVILPGDVTMEMVKIPAGIFQMGSPDSDSWADSNEKPQHTVNIGYEFYLGKTEITQEQWLAVMGNWPATEPGTTYGIGDDYPAYYISWDDCQNFITEIDKLGLGKFRLPSEAEWEYACRGGSTTRYCFGDSTCISENCTSCELNEYGWWCGNNGEEGNPDFGTKEVGKLLPNAFGLYDMHGNVREWCQDNWHNDYIGAPTDGSAWESTTSPICRGGSWSYHPDFCTSTYRNALSSTYRSRFGGFRLVRDQ